MLNLIKKISVMGLLLTALFLTACGGQERPDRYNKKIISTTFAGYDWARNIVSDAPGYDLLYLTKSGVDLHSFTPTTRDIADIATADLVIYIGGPSDQWVKDAVENKVNPNQQVICLMDLLKNRIVEEEIVEGMTEEEGETGEVEYDEHVWLSLDNAAYITEGICRALCRIDGEKKDYWSEKCETYVEKLNRLEDTYREEILKAPLDTIIVCDRFPFRYLFDEFNIKYFAAFPGCSAESEAGFDTVVFLSGKVDELNVNNVCVLENSPGNISGVVLNNAGKKNVGLLSLNSLQSISMADIEAGDNYVNLMERNLDTILKLLGE